MEGSVVLWNEVLGPNRTIERRRWRLLLKRATRRRSGRSSHRRHRAERKFPQRGVPGEELYKVYNRFSIRKSCRTDVSLLGRDSEMETATRLHVRARVTLVIAKEGRARSGNIEKVRCFCVILGRVQSNSDIGRSHGDDSGHARESRPAAQTCARDRVTRIETKQVPEERTTTRRYLTTSFTRLGREVAGFFRRYGIPIEGEGTLIGWSALSLFPRFAFRL